VTGKARSARAKSGREEGIVNSPSRLDLEGHPKKGGTACELVSSPSSVESGAAPPGNQEGEEKGQDFMESLLPRKRKSSSRPPS